MKAFTPQQLAKAGLRLAGRYPIDIVVTTLANYLKRHGRSRDFPWIRAALRVEEEHQGSVKIITAQPLLDSEQQKLLKAFPGAVFEIHPRIIGGIVLTIGSTVYDHSLRAHLSQLKTQLGKE